MTEPGQSEQPPRIRTTPPKVLEQTCLRMQKMRNRNAGRRAARKRALDANRLRQRRFRTRQKAKSGFSVTGIGVHGERGAKWLGQFRPAKVIDVASLPPLPAFRFGDKTRAPKRKPKQVAYCSRQCGKSLELGRYKTTGNVCPSCRRADAAKLKAKRPDPSWGVRSMDELYAQLNDTRDASELEGED